MPRKPARAPDNRLWNITPTEVARKINMTPDTVRNYMRNGELDYRRIGSGGQYRTCQEALDEFLNKYLREVG